MLDISHTSDLYISPLYTINLFNKNFEIYKYHIINSILWLRQGKTSQIDYVIVPCSNPKTLIMESILISLRSLMKGCNFNFWGGEVLIDNFFVFKCL